MLILQQESWRILGNLLYTFRGPLFLEDCNALKTLYFRNQIKRKRKWKANSAKAGGFQEHICWYRNGG